jgi:hypothetical protein
MIREAIIIHKTLWTKLVWERWDALAFEEKIAWLIGINHAIAILTLIEILIFKR